MYAQQWQLKGRLVEKVDRTTPLDAAEILVSPLGGDVTSSSLSDEASLFTIDAFNRHFRCDVAYFWLLDFARHILVETK